MILFFDTYITDKPLTRVNVVANDDLRSGKNSYTMPLKMDIAKYTLTTYSLYPWSKVIIRYGCSQQYTKKQIASFDAYIKHLFPKATIIYELRSTLIQKDFKAVIAEINATADDWVFYSPNNDHPMICNTFAGIYDGLTTAEKYRNTYDYISIVYSHFSEFIRAPYTDSLFHQGYAQDATLIDDNQKACVYVRKDGDNSSCQIVNKKLFNYWFTSHDLGATPLMRAETIRGHFLTHNQLMIVPKREICAHFDGYSHTIDGPCEIRASQIPPLFIPNGFFDQQIKISFGYTMYRKGWVNINPRAEKYVFEDQVNGTDLKVLLSDLPMSWRGRVCEIDVNKNLSWLDVKKKRDDYYRLILDPWANQKIIKRAVAIKRELVSSLHKLQKNVYKGIPWPETLEGREKLAILGLQKNKLSIKLHVGCGARVLKGWINIDLFFTPYKNYLKYFKEAFYGKAIRGSIKDFYAFNLVSESIPLPDNSVETIFHEDFIEHLDQKEQYIFLSETLRILKKGGVHRINTPEITSSMKMHSQFLLGNAGVYKEEWEKHIHKNILSKKIIIEMAKSIGYSDAIIQKRDVSKAQIPREYRPDPHDRPDTGNLHIDLIK